MTTFRRVATIGATVLLLAAHGWAEAPDAAGPSNRILPAQDPPAQGPPIKYLKAVANKHPRLLLTAERIPQLRAFYRSPEGKVYRDQIDGYVPSCTVPSDRRLTGAWSQEYGLFKLPMVALHYVVTKDKASLEKSVAYLKWLAGTANWSSGGEAAVEDKPEAYAKILQELLQFGPQDERNSDHGASFTMVGAALTWDWLYNDLDPAFREQFRQALWQHARAMYYGGHKSGNPGGAYWRGVPAYNHRWYRDWGMALAALAAAEGRPEEQWFLAQVEKELQFMAMWLPADGSQHEGPGYGSSAGGLGVAFQVSDELTGTSYLNSPFYQAAGPYVLYVSAPGWHESMYFADCFTSTRAVHPFFLKTAVLNRQADVADGIRHCIQVNATRFGVRDYGWLSLLCDDPRLKGGQYAKLPATVFLPDLGITIARDSWQPDAVAARFKCGPMGGYKANAWREHEGRRRRCLALSQCGPRPPGRKFLHALRQGAISGRDRPLSAAPRQALIESQYDSHQWPRPNRAGQAGGAGMAAARLGRHDPDGQDHRLEGERRGDAG